MIAVRSAGPAPPTAAVPTTSRRNNSNTDGSRTSSRTAERTMVSSGGPTTARTQASWRRRNGRTTRGPGRGSGNEWPACVLAALITWTSIGPELRMMRLTIDPDVYSAHLDRRDAPMTSCVACSARAASRRALGTSEPAASTYRPPSSANSARCCCSSSSDGPRTPSSARMCTPTRSAFARVAMRAARRTR